MKVLLALLLLGLGGCAGSQPRVMVTLPPVAPVKKAIKDAHTSSTETKDAVAKTKIALEAAQASAQSASKATGEVDFALRIAPVIEQLKEAQQTNEDALARATVAESRASTAEAQAEQLEQKQAQAETEKTKMVERLNYLEPKYGAAVGLLWKWRLLAIGTWALIGLAVAAKFYFKFPI